MSRVCIIGAGSSGIASCQVLHARDIPFDCFEAGSSVGGNWRYNNDSGMSSAYRSLHAKSSRRGMQYAALPMPGNYPDYLSHEMIVKYLDDFVDHFGFRGKIHFLTEVTKVKPAMDGGWDVTVRRRDTGAERTGRYASVLVANGHHWDPRFPERPSRAQALLLVSRFIPAATVRQSHMPGNASSFLASATPPATSQPIAARWPPGRCLLCGGAPTSSPNTCWACLLII